METPLITRASSSNSAGAGGAADGGDDGVRKPSKAYRRRSDAIAFGTNYQKAAALVDLAEDGVGLPEEVLNDLKFERAAKFYFIYIRLDLLWSLNLFAMVLLNFLEKPLWCTKFGDYSCEDREYFFLGELPYLNSAQSLIYEGATLFILVLHSFYPLSYEGYQLYWKSSINKLKAGPSSLDSDVRYVGLHSLSVSRACYFFTFQNRSVYSYCLCYFDNQGYKVLTGTSWSLTFFISFYLITILLLLNLVVAFVLEAFFAEMELETSNESEADEDAPDRKNRRHHVGIKTRSRTVDILLHHILSAELSETQSCRA